jgi:glutamyl-tRNA synthetase
MSKVIGRFAPSPTGSLHIGGARTALFAWLYSKSQGGECLLRLEDTDTERSKQEYTDSIIESFKWLCIEFDGEPFYQSKNKTGHLSKAKQLIEDGKAYYCDCSVERLNKLRAEQQKVGLKPKYDGKCRDLGLEIGSDSVIRFKNPKEGKVGFKDLVRGEMEVANEELDDLILVRSNSTPTYNFCVVVDDLDMGVTHVIRGDDHINNTFRQINIFQALEEKLPIYGHVPMILGEDGKRMSKRQGAVSVFDYKEMGVLPEALLNYLTKLGWSYGDQEIFEFLELIEKFKDGKINNAPATFSLEKLYWFNKEYLSNLNEKDLISRLIPYSKYFQEDDYSTQVIKLIRERCSLLSDFEQEAKYFYEDLEEIDPDILSKIFNDKAISILEKLSQEFQAMDTWTSENIHEAINRTMKILDVGMADVGKPLRLAITGRMNAPSVDKISEVLGQDKVVQRLRDVLDKFL